MKLPDFEAFSKDLIFAIKRSPGTRFIVEEGRLRSAHSRAVAAVYRGPANPADSFAAIASVVCISLASDPPCTPEVNFRLAERFLRRVVHVNSLGLSKQFTWQALQKASEKGTDQDAQIAALRSLVFATLEDSFGAPLPQIRESASYPSGPPIEAFVGVPMTNLPEDRLQELEDLCSKIASELADLGVSTYLPMFWSSTRAEDARAFHPETHDIDVDRLTRSDFLVAIHEQPSTGLGIALAYGFRSGVAQLHLGQEETTGSPLVIGMPADSEFKPIDDTNLPNAVAEYVKRRWTDLELRRRKRLRRRPRCQPYLDRIAQALSEINETSGHPSTTILPRRLLEIRRSPDHFATATVEEVLDIAEVIGVEDLIFNGQPAKDLSPGHSGSVSFLEYQALARAAEKNSWPPARCNHLIQKAQLARTVERRLELLSEETWELLDDEG